MIKSIYNIVTTLKDVEYDSFVYNNKKIVVVNNFSLPFDNNLFSNDEKIKNPKRIFLAYITNHDSYDLLLHLPEELYNQALDYYLKLKKVYSNHNIAKISNKSSAKTKSTNNIENLIKISILIDTCLENELISKEDYLKIKAGVDSLIVEYEFNINPSPDTVLRTSDLNLVKMAKQSKSISIEQKDILVKDYIIQEVQLIKRFKEYIEKQGKLGVEEFMKFLNSHNI